MSDENTLTASETAAPQSDTVTEAPKEAEAKVETPDAPEPKEAAPQEAEGEKTEKSEPKSTGDDESDPEKPKPKRKSRAQERIEQTTRDNRNLRRQVARLNRKIGELQGQKPLREEDFSNPADYQAATIKRATQEASLETQAESVNAELQELKAKRADAWSEIVAEASQEIPDFEAVFDASVPVSEAMAELIMDSDAPAQVAYWLGKNKGEARRISELSPVEAARAIGQVEARLAAPKPKTVSSAPKPVPTVAAKGSPSLSRQPNELASNMKDYASYWEKREGVEG
ncbi:MAG: hypothetical protein AAGF48_12935 [Pseudomonadota bacterium]